MMGHANWLVIIAVFILGCTLLFKNRWKVLIFTLLILVFAIPIIGEIGGNARGGTNFEKEYISKYIEEKYENYDFEVIDLKFKNKNDMLTVNYRSGLMILDLGSVGSEGFKFTSAIQIYLSPTKAHMLVDQINTFLKYRAGDDIDPAKGFGVNTGMGEKVSFIAFSTEAGTMRIG